MPFRVTLYLFATAALAAPAWAAATAVHVTGRPMQVNGHTEVPVGLFGVHAIQLTPELVRDWGLECLRVMHAAPGSNVTLPAEGTALADLKLLIDCQGDRYHPATCLTDPNFRETLARAGRQYAEKCRQAGYKGCVEFWNEPYLNWATKPGVNYDPKFYEAGEAAEGKPMRIKGWERPLEHLVWSRAVRTVHAGSGATDLQAYLAYSYIGKDRAAGDEFEFRGRRFRNAETWWGRDPTQVSYYSGRQNAQFYTWMFVPYARAVKETDPGVTVIGGWDFHINSGGWQAWRDLYKPFIDAAIEWLDGVTEHHYGSDSRMTAAAYEVVVAYAVARHGKWLRCYNTETAGCVDPEVPGGRHGAATPYGAYNYGLRDIVELVCRCPDKAASRTAHGSLTPGWGGGGDEFLFRLLKDLRGRLVHATSADLDVWPAASLSRDRLVVVLYNDRAAAADMAVRVDAPAGTSIQKGRKAWVEAAEPKGPLALREEPLRADGKAFEGTVRLPAKAGVKLVFALRGTPPEAPALVRRQFFAGEILQPVAAGSPLTLKVKIDPDLLVRAEAARLRLVLEGLRGSRGRVRVNGTDLALPDHQWITDVPIEPRVLKAENTLVFEASDGGYQVDAASIVLDAPAP